MFMFVGALFWVGDWDWEWDWEREDSAAERRCAASRGVCGTLKVEGEVHAWGALLYVAGEEEMLQA